MQGPLRLARSVRCCFKSGQCHTRRLGEDWQRVRHGFLPWRRRCGESSDGCRRGRSCPSRSGHQRPGNPPSARRLVYPRPVASVKRGIRNADCGMKPTRNTERRPVTQSFTLLYRRVPLCQKVAWLGLEIFRTSTFEREVCRLKICGTAGYKPALRRANQRQ